MGVMNRMNRYISICFVSIVIILYGCTTCHEVLVSSASYGAWVADVRHRMCGSYAGYSVALYRINEPPASNGNSDEEPFQAIYRSKTNNLNNLPVHIWWESNKHLIIRHDTRMSLHDSESKPMVVKADKSFQEIAIEYIPEPVLWDKKNSKVK